MTTPTATRPTVEKARDALHLAERHLVNAKRDAAQANDELNAVLAMLDDKPQAVSTHDLVNARTEAERADLIVAAAERGVEQAQADVRAAQLVDLESRAVELFAARANDDELAQARAQLREAQARYDALTTAQDVDLFDLARELLDAGAPRVQPGAAQTGWIGPHNTQHPVGINLSDGRHLVNWNGPH